MLPPSCQLLGSGVEYRSISIQLTCTSSCGGQSAKGQEWRQVWSRVSVANIRSSPALLCIECRNKYVLRAQTQSTPLKGLDCFCWIFLLHHSLVAQVCRVLCKSYLLRPVYHNPGTGQSGRSACIGHINTWRKKLGISWPRGNVEANTSVKSSVGPLRRWSRLNKKSCETPKSRTVHWEKCISINRSSEQLMMSFSAHQPL